MIGVIFLIILLMFGIYYLVNYSRYSKNFFMKKVRDIKGRTLGRNPETLIENI